MDGEMIAAVMHPEGFRIRSKKDAKRFLDDLFCQGSTATIKDVSHKGMHLIIDRRISEKTLVAYERDGKSILEPDLMRDGTDAVDIVWKCRKSINQRYFNDKDE